MIEIQTQDARMKDIIRLAEGTAATKNAVLIQGENGTGKNTLAKFIHEKSNRAAASLVTVNCAQQPEMLLETELFGFEKGAFAGTVSEKRGKFEIANGGTLVLDNVSELPAKLQAKILKVLETGLVERIGSKGGIPVDVRIIAITNKNITETINTGKFSENLFFRVSTTQIMLPPLRERTADMKAIALDMLASISARSSKKANAIADEAVEKLCSMEFTGNLRELEGILERAILHAVEGTVRAENIMSGNSLEALHQGSGAHSQNWEELARWIPGRTLDDIERAVILSSLDHNKGNRTHTARELGISIRTLRNKLNLYRKAGISV